MGTEKIRKAFYIEEELLGQVDALLPQADVRSRNEFVNRALRFYIGYLTSEKNRKLYADNHLLCHACNGKGQREPHGSCNV